MSIFSEIGSHRRVFNREVWAFWKTSMIVMVKIVWGGMRIEAERQVRMLL